MNLKNGPLGFIAITCKIQKKKISTGKKGEKNGILGFIAKS